MLEENNNAHITTTLSSDENGDLILEFPDELLQAVGWSDGNVLGIEVFAGRIIFRKLEAVD
jgi:hypothetical protein